MNKITQSDFAHIQPYTKQAGAPKGVSDRERYLTSEEAKLKVWQLYKNGRTSYAMIERETSIPITTIGRWIREQIKAFAAERKGLAAEFLEVELQRLDYMMELCMEDITQLIMVSWEPNEEGKKERTLKLVERVDVQIIDRVLRIQERRSKYLALDKPVEVKVEHEFDLEELIKAALAIERGDKPKAIEAEFKEVETERKNTDDNDNDK